MTTEEFKAKMLPHYRAMYRVAASVIVNGVEAGDVVQDIVLKLYERRNQLNEVADIKSYCLYAVRNACLNIIRDRKTHVTTDELVDIDSTEGIHQSLECREMSDIVGKAMNRLLEDQLKVFKMSAFGGLSNAEIADMLGFTQGNVRVLLSRARNKIKELLLKQSAWKQII